MADYAAMIRQTETEVRALISEIDATYELRDLTKRRYAAWEIACAALHAYRSPIDDLLDACEIKDFSKHPELRDFAFTYVETSPYFFRSGYTMERVLRTIKRLDFSESEQAILRATILKRITHGARREFKHLCRLIPKIKTKSFESTLQDLAKSDQKSIRFRATLALSYLTSSSV